MVWFWFYFNHLKTALLSVKSNKAITSLLLWFEIGWLIYLVSNWFGFGKHSPTLIWKSIYVDILHTVYWIGIYSIYCIILQSLIFKVQNVIGMGQKHKILITGTYAKKKKDLQCLEEVILCDDILLHFQPLCLMLVLSGDQPLGCMDFASIQDYPMYILQTGRTLKLE